MQRYIDYMNRVIMNSIDNALRNYAEPFARTEFDSAPNPGPDPSSTMIGVSVDQTEGSIMAYGDQALFIEFGTGVRFPDTHPESAELGMTRGGYGHRLGASPHGWDYPMDKGNFGGISTTPSLRKKNSFHTYGQPATMPMARARKEIEDNWESIVNEVRE